MRTISTAEAAPAVSALRLFSPAAETSDVGPRLSPDMRLRDLFTKYALPVVGKACNWSKGTVASYTEAVDHWSELTHDVGIDAIDVFETSEFVAGLRLQPGRRDEFLATASVRKHCFAVQRLLSIAGPRMRRHKKDIRRFGCGLIVESPWIEAPDADEELPNGDFTEAEIKAILAACKTMTTPNLKGVDAPAWWNALVLFLCATGMRIGSAMELDWSMLDPAKLLLRIPGKICKKKRPDEKYVHPAAYQAIAAIRGPSPRIFPWPNWPRAGAVRWLQRQRELLLLRAELPEDRRFGFHGFRKYHATELFDIDELAARDAMNHRDVATTRASYANHRRQSAAKLQRQKAAIDQLPLFQ